MKKLIIALLAVVTSVIPLNSRISSASTSTPAPVTAPAPGNVIQNPFFNTTGGGGQGLFTPWWLEVKTGAAATLHEDTSAARVDISQTNGQYWGVQLEQHIPISTGDNYTISFWAKASSPRFLPLALQQAAAPYTSYFAPSVSLDTSWRQYTLRYNSTVADPDTFFSFNLGEGIGSVWITGVVVTNVDASGNPLPAPAPVSNSYFRGLNLDGGMQGLCCGTDAFALPATLDWAKSKGFDMFRVGIAWAHLQPTPGGPLDSTYLGMMDALVSAARARGQKIAFVPMDRRESPVADFVDLWTKLAQHYKSESAIWGYDLMNEPDQDVWNTSYLPQIITAIRQVDMTHTIIVETSTGGWGQYWASHTIGLPVQDPANNVIYEAHFYFDTPANGQYPQGGAFDVPNNDVNIGVERATDFVTWCAATNVRCYAGEYGIPGGWTNGDRTCTNGASAMDPRWLTVLDNFLTYLDHNHISGTYWEAGPFGDVNDLGPTCSGQDRPQMAILQKHPGTVDTLQPLSVTATPSIATSTSVPTRAALIATATSTPPAPPMNTAFPTAPVLPANTAFPTAPVLPTNTATHTPIPPTATSAPAPPTATQTPTLIPPTAIATPVPPTATATPVPPTATATPTLAVTTNTPTPPSPTISASASQAMLFSTGFESGDPQPSWTDAVESARNVTGICCGLDHTETGVRPEIAHTGAYALRYSGFAASPGAYSYSKVFDLSGQHLTIAPTTTLSYWILPQDGVRGSTGENSAHVTVDIDFSDGSTLDASGAVDQYGDILAPARQGRHMQANAWNFVSSHIGDKAAGKTIDRILVGYQSDIVGAYRGYIDDIRLANS